MVAYTSDTQFKCQENTKGWNFPERLGHKDWEFFTLGGSLNPLNFCNEVERHYCVRRLSASSYSVKSLSFVEKGIKILS